AANASHRTDWSTNLMDLKDKAVLVTGGSSGHGLAIAVALAGEGCRGAITGRDGGKLRQAVAGYDGQPPLIAHPCDVSDRAATKELFAWMVGQLGPPEILVNNAGINVPRRSMAELDPKDWDRMLAINAT